MLRGLGLEFLSLGGLLLTLGLWLVARRAERMRSARLKGRAAPTLGARLSGPLPPALAVLATMGESRSPGRTIDATIHHVAPGVRLITLVIGGACLWLIWGPSAGIYLPAGPVSWGTTALVALALAHQFTFCARADRDRLVTETLLHWRREARWSELAAIRDNGAYEYVLQFADRRLKLPKHLVGMPDLLHWIGETLERNAGQDARTPRG